MIMCSGNYSHWRNSITKFHPTQTVCIHRGSTSVLGAVNPLNWSTYPAPTSPLLSRV